MIRTCYLCGTRIADNEEALRDRNDNRAHTRCVEDSQKLRERMLTRKKVILGPSKNLARDEHRKRHGGW
jgi:hypothetical protein